MPLLQIPWRPARCIASGCGAPIGLYVTPACCALLLFAWRWLMITLCIWGMGGLCLAGAASTWERGSHAWLARGDYYSYRCVASLVKKAVRLAQQERRRAQSLVAS